MRRAVSSVADFKARRKKATRAGGFEGAEVRAEVAWSSEDVTGLRGIVATNSLKEGCRINDYEIMDRCGDCHDSAAHQLIVQFY